MFASDFPALPKGSDGSASASDGHKCTARNTVFADFGASASPSPLYADCILLAKAGPRFLGTTGRKGALEFRIQKQEFISDLGFGNAVSRLTGRARLGGSTHWEAADRSVAPA
jgi:hypothetical protein